MNRALQGRNLRISLLLVERCWYGEFKLGEDDLAERENLAGEKLRSLPPGGDL